MTTGSFSEGLSKQITLPEDDADNFGRIIEHLYGNNDAAFDVILLGLDGAEKLAGLYGLAEKYQLPGFQDLVIRTLKQIDLIPQQELLHYNHPSPCQIALSHQFPSICTFSFVLCQAFP